MRIGIDVDGVLIDFEERFRYKAEIFDFIERKNNIIFDENSYVIEEKYGWSNNDWEKFSNKYLIELTQESKMIIGAKEIVKLLKNEGHELIIISTRGTEFDEMIRIVEEKFKKEELIFDKYYWKSKNKLEIIKNENIDIMIDDNPNTCKKLSENKIKTLYFKNIYGNELKENIYLKEVKNWGEIYRHIMKLENNFKELY